jgi:hypothetical protein
MHELTMFPPFIALESLQTTCVPSNLPRTSPNPKELTFFRDFFALPKYFHDYHRFFSVKSTIGCSRDRLHAVVRGLGGVHGLYNGVGVVLGGARLPPSGSGVVVVVSARPAVTRSNTRIEAARTRNTPRRIKNFRAIPPSLVTFLKGALRTPFLVPEAELEHQIHTDAEAVVISRYISKLSGFFIP